MYKVIVRGYNWRLDELCEITDEFEESGFEFYYIARKYVNMILDLLGRYDPPPTMLENKWYYDFNEDTLKETVTPLIEIVRY